MALKLKMKKEEVEESVGDAETLQKQIYNYIKVRLLYCQTRPKLKATDSSLSSLLT